MSTRQLLLDFLSFLRRPTTEKRSHTPAQAIVHLFRLWCCLFVFIIFGGVLVDSIIDVPQHDRFEEVMQQIGIAGFIVFAVLIGPLLEEVAFRLAMRFRLRYVLVGAVAFVLYMGQAASAVIEKYTENGMLYFTLLLLLALVAFISVCFKYTAAMAKGWNTYFPLIFYGLSFSFALIHIFNFEDFPIRVILLAPIITLPQFILGLGMGYLRMRFGFWYGYLFHVLNNGFAISVFLLLPH